MTDLNTQHISVKPPNAQNQSVKPPNAQAESIPADPAEIYSIAAAEGMRTATHKGLAQQRGPCTLAQ